MGLHGSPTGALPNAAVPLKVSVGFRGVKGLGLRVGGFMGLRGLGFGGVKGLGVWGLRRRLPT